MVIHVSNRWKKAKAFPDQNAFTLIPSNADVGITKAHAEMRTTFFRPRIVNMESEIRAQLALRPETWADSNSSVGQVILAVQPAISAIWAKRCKEMFVVNCQQLVRICKKKPKEKQHEFS